LRRCASIVTLRKGVATRCEGGSRRAEWRDKWRQSSSCSVLSSCSLAYTIFDGSMDAGRMNRAVFEPGCARKGGGRCLRLQRVSGVVRSPAHHRTGLSAAAASAAVVCRAGALVCRCCFCPWCNADSEHTIYLLQTGMVEESRTASMSGTSRG
jgi:hypothetical protein